MATTWALRHVGTDADHRGQSRVLEEGQPQYGFGDSEEAHGREEPDRADNGGNENECAQDAKHAVGDRVTTSPCERV